jgi:hypothetical protein
MKTFARKLAIVATGTVLTFGVLGAASPAEAAKDTSWKQDTSWKSVVMLKDTSW